MTCTPFGFLEYRARQALYAAFSFTGVLLRFTSGGVDYDITFTSDGVEYYAAGTMPRVSA